MSRWTLRRAVARHFAGRLLGPTSTRDSVSPPSPSPRASSAVRICALGTLVLTAGVAVAATATYGYDALGRLTSITSDDGKIVVYKLDAAGNRTQVLSATPPASITVPTSNTTGSYSISWGASTGTVSAYKLYEATNASFTGQTQVYSGTALSVSLTGRQSGTYYYRVAACVDTICSGYRTGTNGVTVTRP